MWSLINLEPSKQQVSEETDNSKHSIQQNDSHKIDNHWSFQWWQAKNQRKQTIKDKKKLINDENTMIHLFPYQVEQAGWPNEGLTFRSIWDKHRYRNGCNSWKWDGRYCQNNLELASPWMLEHPWHPDLLFRWKLTFWRWTQGSVSVELGKSPLCRARSHQIHIPAHELKKKRKF